MSDTWPARVESDKQFPDIAKHPDAMFHPPAVPTRVEVLVVKLAMPLMENSEPGDVVAPTPTRPWLVMVKKVEVA